MSLATRVMSGWHRSRWRSLQPAQEPGLSATARGLCQDQAHAGADRRAAQARSQGQPGYLRVDTVHQGDQDGVKGLYHINAVDEVTQWQIVGATRADLEAWLMPVLEAMLEQFPFRIQGFHSDNGSEFINHTVAKLLNKLLIEQTKSRPRQSNDNGLVETKNGGVIRKHIGYGHIGPTMRSRSSILPGALQSVSELSSTLRPADIEMDERGRERRVTSATRLHWKPCSPGKACSVSSPGFSLDARSHRRRP